MQGQIVYLFMTIYLKVDFRKLHTQSKTMFAFLTNGQNYWWMICFGIMEFVKEEKEMLIYLRAKVFHS